MNRPIRFALPALIALAALFLGLPAAFAQVRRPQEDRHTLVQQGFRSDLPVVKELPSRPQIGPDGIDAMFGLSSIDGEFEVIAAQAKYLHLKRDLARDGKLRPLVAVGHVGVLDVDIINSRLIRVVGRRVGTTDLTIMTDTGEFYALRVHVVYDLETLRGRIAQQFPESRIPLRQSRETIVVSGDARDPIETRNGLRFLGSHLNAEQSVILGRTSGGGSGTPAPPPAVAPQPAPDR